MLTWRQMTRKGRHRQTRQVTLRSALFYAGLGVLMGAGLLVAGYGLFETLRGGMS